MCRQLLAGQCDQRINTKHIWLREEPREVDSDSTERPLEYVKDLGFFLIGDT